MTIYYSPSTRGFYDTSLHGERTMLVDDPTWVRPQISVLLQKWQPEDGQTDADRPVVSVPDAEAVAPQVRVDNPDCLLPADAREISPELYAQLMEAQVAGQRIEQDAEGNPIAVDVPQSIPAVVSMRQARLALLQAGKLQAVQDAIAGLPSPQREAAQIEWEFAATVERQSAFVASLSVALGFSADDLDELFTKAASL